MEYTKKKANDRSTVVLASGEELDITGCVAELREGALIGETGLLDEQARNATVRTHAESEFLVLDSETFNRILKDDMLRKKREKLRALREILPHSVLKEGAEAVFDRIANFFKEETRALRSVLVKQGERTDSVWIILKGQCVLLEEKEEEGITGNKFVSHTRAVGTLMQGQFVGLDSVMFQQDEKFSVQVSSASAELFQISRKDIWTQVPPQIMEKIRRLATAQRMWRDNLDCDRAIRQAGRGSKDDDLKREMEERTRPKIKDSPYIKDKMNQGYRNLEAICTHYPDHIPEELDFVRNSRNPDFFLNMQLVSKENNSTVVTEDSPGDTANRRFNTLRPLILSKHNNSNDYLAPTMTGSISDRSVANSSKSFDFSKSVDFPSEDPNMSNAEEGDILKPDSPRGDGKDSFLPINLLIESATKRATYGVIARQNEGRIQKSFESISQRKTKKPSPSLLMQGFQSVAMRRIKGLTADAQEMMMGQSQESKALEAETLTDLPCVKESAEPESEPMPPSASPSGEQKAPSVMQKLEGIRNNSKASSYSSSVPRLGRAVSPHKKYGVNISPDAVQTTFVCMSFKEPPPSPSQPESPRPSATKPSGPKRQSTMQQLAALVSPGSSSSGGQPELVINSRSEQQQQEVTTPNEKKEKRGFIRRGRSSLENIGTTPMNQGSTLPFAQPQSRMEVTNSEEIKVPKKGS